MGKKKCFADVSDVHGMKLKKFQLYENVHSAKFNNVPIWCDEIKENYIQILIGLYDFCRILIFIL